MKRENLTRYLWLSMLAAVLTIALKISAYFLTDSIGLLSDALETITNLVASFIALLLLRAAALPPDEEHAFGHDKAEYFASGIEGTLILLAAVGIGWTAGLRLFHPQSLARVDLGIIITLVATIINFAVARVLLDAGRKFSSITLEADGQHLMTDVWTSLGVVAGILVVLATGWTILDPIIALLVAANVIWSGVRLMARSTLGLMDPAVSPEQQEAVRKVLDRYAQAEGIEYHALRTRQSGARQFANVHILVPGDWTVHRGHELLERIEADVRREAEPITLFTHLESLDDPASWHDIELDRFES